MKKAYLLIPLLLMGCSNTAKSEPVPITVSGNPYFDQTPVEIMDSIIYYATSDVDFETLDSGDIMIRSGEDLVQIGIKRNKATTIYIHDDLAEDSEVEEAVFKALDVARPTGFDTTVDGLIVDCIKQDGFDFYSFSPKK